MKRSTIFWIVVLSSFLAYVLNKLVKHNEYFVILAGSIVLIMYIFTCIVEVAWDTEVVISNKYNITYQINNFIDNFKF